jgi:hypothetical protein
LSTSVYRGKRKKKEKRKKRREKIYQGNWDYKIWCRKYL